jgi:hypothetical protein
MGFWVLYEDMSYVFFGGFWMSLADFFREKRITFSILKKHIYRIKVEEKKNKERKC